MLYDSQPYQLRELDDLQLTRECWMCAHMKIAQGSEYCDEAKGFLEDMMGVKFDWLTAKVQQNTNADNCQQFELTENRETLEVLDEYIEEKRQNYTNHADHYSRLWREYA